MYIKGVFDRVFSGQVNPFTPNIMRYGRKGKYLFELSQGKGIDGPDLYGVTVIEKDTHRHDLSKSFASESDANLYIKSLKTMV